MTTVRQLEYLQHFANRRSQAETGRRLGVSRARVSEVVGILEGRGLVRRVGLSVKVTDEGRRMLNE